MKVIHAENPLDLSQQSSEEPEVSSRHPDEARYDVREELFVGKCDLGRCPFLFEQFLHLGRFERSEFVNEPDSRIELRKTGDSLLNTGHPDDNHSGAALVKNRSHLFEVIHL